MSHSTRRHGFSYRRFFRQVPRTLASRNRAVQAGFTLLELMISVGLSAFLMLMVSGMSADLWRSMASNAREIKVSGEATFALETLRRDFGGQLPGDLTGEKGLGSLVGRLVVGDGQLVLCFEGSPVNGTADWAVPDVVITYDVQDDRLVRTNGTTGTAFTVAENVKQFIVIDQGTGVSIELTLESRDVNRTYTLVAQDP